jgi:hypothetical protein
MSNYTGNSIVDYLKNQGQASDYSSRTALAGQYGIQGYQGTAEQNTQLLGMLRGGNQPTTPLQKKYDELISSFGEIKTPDIPMPTGDTTGVNGMIAYYQSQMEQERKAAEDYRTQMEAQQATQQEQTQSWLDKLTGSKSPSEVKADEFANIGVKPTDYFTQNAADIAELDALSKDYNAAVATRDEQIAKATGVPGQDLNFMNNQIAQIERNAAPRLNQMSADINSKAAIMEAKSNRWTEAQNYVNQAVSDYTADLKWNFDMYNAIYDQNQDIIDRLDTKYQNALSESKDSAEKAWTLALNEQTEVGNLMIQNPQAGIQIGDSLATAQQKVARTPKAEKPDIFGSAETGYQQLVYNPTTNSYDIQPVSGGAGGTGLSLSLQSDFNDDLASISDYSDRETALKVLNNKKSALISKYKEENYNKLLAEVDRIFPPPVPEVKKQPSIPAVAEAGKKTGGVIKKLFTSELLGEGLLKGGQAVSSFWQGLFQ